MLLSDRVYRTTFFRLFKPNKAHHCWPQYQQHLLREGKLQKLWLANECKRERERLERERDKEIMR